MHHEIRGAAVLGWFFSVLRMSYEGFGGIVAQADFFSRFSRVFLCGDVVRDCQYGAMAGVL